jgi:hypothetical protein
MVIQTLALKDCSSLRVDEREALRYLGVKEADESVLSLLKSCEKELVELSEPRAVYAVVDIANDGETVDFGFMKVKSESLSMHLAECDEAYIIATTLGVGIDRLFEKYNRILQTKAAVCDATASALIESFCDYVNESVVENREAVMRFSPGYGDFDLKHQKEILDYLGEGQYLYFWHISELVIYDTPKELSEFTRFCDGVGGNIGCRGCEYYYTESNESIGFYEECGCDNSRPIKRPPQSWCYVEKPKGE